MLYASPVCQIDIAAGWTPSEPTSEQEGSRVIAFAPPSEDARLTLTTFDASTSPVDACTWVEQAAKINRVKHRHVEDVQIACFTGYAMWFDTETKHIRAWALQHNSKPLDISYQCQRSIAGRDDAAVNRMLTTIQPFG